jgi:dihydroflavonol-4-reductase
MNIAITGASGHIGVNLCRLLAEKGHSIRALVHKNIKNLRGIPIKTVKGDLMDSQSLDELARGADIVFHLAAVISIRGKKVKDLFEKNVDGTRNMLEAALKEKVKRFIHFSSIHALVHEPRDQALDESRGLAIDDKMAYSRSKALAEIEVFNAVKDGLDAVILNPTAVIGPYDFTPSLVGRALILMSLGKLSMLPPGGYDWVDVRDIAQAAAASISKGRKGERYLLSGHWREIKEIAAIVSGITGREKKFKNCPMWLAHLGLPFIHLHCAVKAKEPLYTRDSLYTLQAGHSNISNKKASKELGFIPRPLEESLKDTLDWFRESGYL